jgi:hypothetical protein
MAEDAAANDASGGRSALAGTLAELVSGQAAGTGADQRAATAQQYAEHSRDRDDTHPLISCAVDSVLSTRGFAPAFPDTPHWFARGVSTDHAGASVSETAVAEYLRLAELWDAEAAAAEAELASRPAPSILRKPPTPPVASILRKAQPEQVRRSA